MTTDLRPVFPEERLLTETIIGEPMKYHGHSVWNAGATRYYVDGKKIKFRIDMHAEVDPDQVRTILEEYQDKNTYDCLMQSLVQHVVQIAERFRIDSAAAVKPSVLQKRIIESLL